MTLVCMPMTNCCVSCFGARMPEVLLYLRSWTGETVTNSHQRKSAPKSCK